MPLVVEGLTCDVIPHLAVDFFHKYPTFKDSACTLTAQPVTTVGPHKLLYVNQREYAVVTPSDEYIDVIGSEDATTCHLLVLRHSGSGATCLAHCDGCDTNRGVAAMVQTVTRLSSEARDGRLELHLIGGFLDDRKESEKLTREILCSAHTLPEELHLVTACITDVNDTVRNGIHFPVIYGIAVEVKTGRIFPATFTDKGPDINVRSACHFGGFRELVNIYDVTTHQLLIGPFSWKPWDEAELFLRLPDHVIRKYLSTSPEQEPPYFEASVRESLKILHHHPHPDKTLFQDGLPWRYQKEADGQWKRVPAPS